MRRLQRTQKRLAAVAGALVVTACACAAGAAAATAAAAATVVHPSLAAGFRNTLNQRSTIGTNLAGVADWSADQPFVNFFKQARPWFSGSASGGWSDARMLKLDANGNVLALLPGQVARAVLFTGLPADPGLSGKTFHVWYTGVGRLDYSGSARLVQRGLGTAKNVDVVQLWTNTDPNTENIMVVTLSRTGSGTYSTNPLRDIIMVSPGGICAANPFVAVANATQCAAGTFQSFATASDRIVFNPQFLEGIKRYRVLRFMDWQRTNNSPVRNYLPRPLPANQFWTTDSGVPLEVMVALSNLLSADPWFCIPHLATDAYVTSFAMLLRNQLDTSRRAYIEYSNEVWNGDFDQTQYAKRQGVGMGAGDEYTNLVRWYSKRAQQVHTRAALALGGTARLRRVMATQAVVPYFTDEILGVGGASRTVDAFAIAPYLAASSVFYTPQQAAELKRLGVSGIIGWLNGTVNSILEDVAEPRRLTGVPNVAAVIQEQLAVVRPKGIPLVTYEGGQHLVAAGGIQGDGELQKLLDAVNRDPRMKDVYQGYLATWHQLTGGSLFNHYVHCDRWSQWGRWGALEYPSQPAAEAPKYAALLAHMAAYPITKPKLKN